MLPQVQGKHVLRQPECCPTWLYTIMHQCWIYAPTDRPHFIAIFDGISPRLVIINNLKHRTFEIRTWRISTKYRPWANISRDSVTKVPPFALKVNRYNLRRNKLSWKDRRTLIYTHAWWLCWSAWNFWHQIRGKKKHSLSRYFFFTSNLLEVIQPVRCSKRKLSFKKEQTKRNKTGTGSELFPPVTK